MTRGINLLPASYKKLGVGMHSDGGNLYLQVSKPKNGQKGQLNRSWLFKYTPKGAKTTASGRTLARYMGLGSINDVLLPEVRETSRHYRKLLREGIDPISHRDAEIAKNVAARTVTMTFDDAAAAYIRQHAAGWKNPKHAAQWSSTLKTYASPVIGRMSVADIDTPHVLKIIEPLWTGKTETASRVRGRIESVLGWATVSGFRKGDNPARWRGHLDNLLPPATKVRVVRHQAALDYSETPSFIAELRERQGMAALALEFVIFTLVRTSDVRRMRHADVDRKTKIWTIPAMTKTGHEHRVPLSDAALAAFDKARAIVKEIGGNVGKSEFAFPNDVTGAALSENAMLATLERMGRKGQATTHGFRSSFRTWALERSSFPWELAEMSLGHRVGSKVERAYQRGDGLKKRIAIMDAWGNFLDKPIRPAKVIALHERSAAQ